MFCTIVPNFMETISHCVLLRRKMCLLAWWNFTIQNSKGKSRDAWSVQFNRLSKQMSNYGREGNGKIKNIAENITASKQWGRGFKKNKLTFIPPESRMRRG